jgi:hypothetical protein
MANPLRLKKRLAANLPTLAAGEPAFTTDTKKLYIGDGTTNTEIGSGTGTDAVTTAGTALSKSSQTLNHQNYGTAGSGYIRESHNQHARACYGRSGFSGDGYPLVINKQCRNSDKACRNKNKRVIR